MALEDATNPMQGVSGPSTFSKRTDLEYQSQSYGDGVAYDANKEAAPLERAAKNPKLSEAPRVSNTGSATEAGVGLYDPTTRKDEPVTSGIDISDGVGSNALMMRSPLMQEKLSDTLATMLPYDQTGEIGILYQQALARGM